MQRLWYTRKLNAENNNVIAYLFVRIAHKYNLILDLIMACVELLLHQVAAVCLNSASIIRYAAPNVAHNPIRGNIQMNS
jgi:hypothetical protein